MLGWRPEVTFAQLLSEMVSEDLDHAKRDAMVRQHGYRVPTRRE
jgi:GDPmannose 4,6-dehydratase